MEGQSPSSESAEAPAAGAPRPGSSRAPWIIVGVLAVVIVLLLASFALGLFSAPSATGATRTLVIGTVLSVSGSLSAFGLDNQNGTDMAVQEINAAGGVNGVPIQIYHQDDKTDPATASSAALTLISQDHVAAIIGATGSGQCSTVLPNAVNNSVFEVSGSCTSPKFSATALTRGWFARTAPSDALQGVVAGYYAYHNRSFTKAAVIGINNAYGTGLATVFANEFKALGGTITPNSPRIVPEISTSYPSYTTDLQAVLGTCPAGTNTPQVVYMVAYPPDGVQLMKDYNSALGANSCWSNVAFMFSEGLFDQTNFINKLVTAGINTTSYQGTAPSAYGGVNGPLYSSWAASYKTKFGVAPTLFTANNYDAVYLIALAAELAGNATGWAIKTHIQYVANGAGPSSVIVHPGEWSKALAAITAGVPVNYEGASGSLNLNATGDPLSGYVVWAVQSGTNQLYNLQIFPESLVTNLVAAKVAQPFPALASFLALPGMVLAEVLQVVVPDR